MLTCIVEYKFKILFPVLKMILYSINELYYTVINYKLRWDKEKQEITKNKNTILKDSGLLDQYSINTGCVINIYSLYSIV